MNERAISSVYTPYFKFLLPGIWSPAVGLLTLGLFLDRLPGLNGDTPPKWMKWACLAIWIIFSITMWRECCRLKKVRVSNDAIYISNYLREIRVPFDQILDVTENRWNSMRPVSIRFRSATVFGDRVVFMPILMPTINFLKSRPHPIVAELKKLAHLSVSDQGT